MMIYIGIARHERIQMLGGPTVGGGTEAENQSEVRKYSCSVKTETNEADVWDPLQVIGAPDVVCTATRAFGK